MENLTHITSETAKAYGERKLHAPEILAVQTHLESCADCRARVAAETGITDAPLQFFDEAAEAEFEHLPYEQLELYADGKLDAVEREIADSHLFVCGDCAADLADLRKYQEIAHAPPLETQIEKPSIVVAPVAVSPSIWQRLFGAGFSPAFAASAAVVVIAVLAVGAWLLTGNFAGGGNEIVRTEPTPQTTFSPIANANSVAPQATFSPQIPDSTNTNVELNNQPSNNSAPIEPPRSEIALTDADGRQIELDANGNLRGAGNLSPQTEKAVRDALRGGRISKPNSLPTTGGGVLMSGGAANGVPFALQTPINKITADSSPALRWKPLAGATAYTVAVVDEKFNVVAQSPRLSATAWKLDKSLPRGANYSWQVTAITADGAEIVSPQSPAPAARFRVLEQAAIDELAAAGKNSHLARGAIFARYGMTDEARAEFEKLARLNPNSAAARKLLQAIR